jgi:hypothetical protein
VVVVAALIRLEQVLVAQVVAVPAGHPVMLEQQEQ